MTSIFFYYLTFYIVFWGTPSTSGGLSVSRASMYYIISWLQTKWSI